MPGGGYNRSMFTGSNVRPAPQAQTHGGSYGKKNTAPSTKGGSAAARSNSGNGSNNNVAGSQQQQLQRGQRQRAQTAPRGPACDGSVSAAPRGNKNDGAAAPPAANDPGGSSTVDGPGSGTGGGWDARGLVLWLIGLARTIALFVLFGLEGDGGRSGGGGGSDDDADEGGASDTAATDKLAAASSPLPPPPTPSLKVVASPGLTALLDEGLYRSYEGELVPTLCAASNLLAEWLEMKEAAAFLVGECRAAAGVPFAGGALAGGGNGCADKDSAGEDARWSEYETVQEFCLSCVSSSEEAIRRLTTDPLAESANLTLLDGGGVHEQGGRGGGGGGSSKGGGELSPASSAAATSNLSGGNASDDDSDPSRGARRCAAGSPSFATAADAGVGRCRGAHARRDCWESPRLFCPDYAWADDAAGACQRLLRGLTKHRFAAANPGAGGDGDEDGSAVAERWASTIAAALAAGSGGATGVRRRRRNFSSFFGTSDRCDGTRPFPSPEAVHAAGYVLRLLRDALPSKLHQFRAAVEANTVVSKRLYLVKCEYRAPLRATFEAAAATKRAPGLALVEKYLALQERDDDGAGDGATLADAASSTIATLQERRDSVEQKMEECWKHPSLVDAVRLERTCESLEADMAKMLLPLANLAREIAEGRGSWKGRLREVKGMIGWEDVQYMKELLRRLKLILCQKPVGADDSVGIRPLLLDLQGVSRCLRTEISMEISFFPPPPPRLFLSRFSNRVDTEAPGYYAEKFVSQIRLLLDICKKNGGALVGLETALVRACEETWDGEMFLAHFEDWLELVKRQRELGAGGRGTRGDGLSSSLEDLSETLRETEIELSIAMASKDQLGLVRQRLADMEADMESRFQIMAKIVNEIGMREMNEDIVVRPMPMDVPMEYPSLSLVGVFGRQLQKAGEVLPMG